MMGKVTIKEAKGKFYQAITNLLTWTKNCGISLIGEEAAHFGGSYESNCVIMFNPPEIFLFIFN